MGNHYEVADVPVSNDLQALAYTTACLVYRILPSTMIYVDLSRSFQVTWINSEYTRVYVEYELIEQWSQLTNDN